MRIVELSNLLTRTRLLACVAGLPWALTGCFGSLPDPQTTGGSETDGDGDGDGDPSGDGDGDPSGDGDGDGDPSGDGDGDPSGDGDGDPSGDGDGDGPEPLACVDGLLDPATGDALVDDSTLGSGDDFDGSCGGASSPDLAYQWNVPYAGWFSIDTIGSGFDTSLYLRDGCSDTEVACSNDYASDTIDSRLDVKVGEDEVYAIVMDGVGGSQGDATLNIQPIVCPAADVGTGAALPQVFTNVGSPNDYSSSCGGENGLERTIRFEVPSAGLWRFEAVADTNGSLESVIYVEDSPACGHGELLQCNKSENPDKLTHSAVSRYFDAGDYATIYVDAAQGAGPFELDATKLSDICPLTPVQDWPDGIYDITTGTDWMTSSCGVNRAYDPWGDPIFYQPDLLVPYDDMEEGAGGWCEITFFTGFPFSLSRMGEDCRGAEFSCTVSNTLINGRYQATFPLGKTGKSFTAVISPLGNEDELSDAWIDGNVEMGGACVI